ncbi:DUF899 family protein [Leptothermofonsia sp. ETS-13]|uniref:DUF899 family protein n=1 Tax=Leptothermofonsia sp. ETS-13 TaxID=3035696 RepID=UPI003BA0E6BD
MIQNEIAHPKIAEKDEWLTARKTLLEHEEELTKHRDRINAEQRRLAMVKLKKEYTFEDRMVLSNSSICLQNGLNSSG